MLLFPPSFLQASRHLDAFLQSPKWLLLIPKWLLLNPSPCLLLDTQGFWMLAAMPKACCMLVVNF